MKGKIVVIVLIQQLLERIKIYLSIYILKYEDIDVILYEIQNGNTPLIIAAKNNNYEIAKL